MLKTTQHAVIHTVLLIFIQWTSIAVIVLNVMALGSTTGELGLLDMKPASQDYLLLVLGGISLLTSSFLICLYLHTYFHLINNRRLAPSRAIQTAELTMGVLLITLWASGTSIITSNYGVSSPCRFVGSEFVQVQSQACEMLEWTIILACTCIAGWAFDLLATLLAFIYKSPQIRTPAFTTETSSLNYPYTEKIASLPSYSSQKQLIAEPEPAAPRCTRTSSLRPTRSWCSELTQDDDERSSFEPVPLDDLPRIQVGMSRMDLTFGARSYDDIKL